MALVTEPEVAAVMAHTEVAVDTVPDTVLVTEAQVSNQKMLQSMSRAKIR